MTKRVPDDGESHGGKEQELRRLASSISNAIRSSPDVLAESVITVPDLSGATLDSTVNSGLVPPPSAYRFMNDFSLLNEKNSLQEIIQQLRSVEDLLIWGHAPGYNKDNVGRDFLDNYCHALLTGPDGPLKCVSPLGAFVLFGPDTLYRDHSHMPNEVYLALTSGGEWRVGNHPWRRLKAGQTIFIPSNAVHAIRTRDEPLLTFSFWLEPGEMEAIAI